VKANIWVKQYSELFMMPTVNIEAWLLKPYIISKALKRSCQTLTVKLLSQSFSEPYEDEVTRLKFDIQEEGLPCIRRVYLQGDGVPWTYGRVVIPPKTYQAFAEKFEKLDNNLIGEQLLFNNPLALREPFEYICLNAGSALYQEIFQARPALLSKDSVWGRRSVFRVEGFPLIVSEYFLPQIPIYCPSAEESAFS